MASTERDQVVIEHIIESRVNALTAFDVTAAFPEARRQLVRKTLHRVKERVSEECDSIRLQTENEFEQKDFDRERFLKLSFWHQSWPDGVRIGITSDELRARAMSLGLNVPEADGRRFDQVVVELDKNAEARDHDQDPFPAWPWYFWLPRPYRHWDERAAIAQFFPVDHANRDSPAVDYLVDRLCTAISVAHPLLQEVDRDA